MCAMPAHNCFGRLNCPPILSDATHTHTCVSERRQCVCEARVCVHHTTASCHRVGVVVSSLSSVCVCVCVCDEAGRDLRLEGMIEARLVCRVQV